MKKILLPIIILSLIENVFSQNVGIGTNAPEAKLHVVNSTENLTELSNSTPLNTGEATQLLFKNGSYYSGLISTYGTSAFTARLGFSTYAAQNAGSLVERISIADNGYVGINNTNPTTRLNIIDPGANLMELTNSQTLSNGIAIKILLKTGGYYTGIIGAYGTGINSARLGFSTYASASSGSLFERMSILDNGNVGINTTTPTTRLEVSGKTKLVQSITDAALEIDGKIKVSGDKAAFILTVSAVNLTSADQAIIIDNPLCNGDPNALLFVTARELAIQGMGGYFVQYNAGLTKWELMISGYSIDYTFAYYRKVCNDDCVGDLMVHPTPNRFTIGDKFNIFIISN